MTIRLRPYQTEANDAVEVDLANGVKRTAVVLPTGTGKTISFADLVRRRNASTDTRSLILVHRQELARQAVAKIHDVDPSLRTGIVKAERNDTDADVIVGSVPTLARLGRREQIEGIGTLIIDECHHATAQSYLDVIDHFDAPVVGWTATLARGDGKALGKVFEKISYEYPLLRAIRAGYLVDVEGIRIKVPDLNLKGLHKTAGDYRDGELGDRLQESMAPETVAKAYREHGSRPDGTLRPAILFAPTVATAHLFTEAMAANGIRAAAIWGDMPSDERTRILGDPETGTLGAFDKGELDVLCNCMVLTEGFDSPRAEVCIIARPTQSDPLYVQMVGRVLRLSPGKIRALVLDVVGTASAHELCTLAVLGGEKLDEVKDGQSLLKAVDELEAEDEASETDQVDSGWTGDVVAETVDLFAGSRQSWLQTHGGHWFIPAGGRIIALVPRGDGRLDVAWFEMPSRTNNWRAKGGGYVIRAISDHGIAMAHGEGAITWDEEVMAAKDRAWRKRKRSDAQINYAKRIGIRVEQLPDNIRAGQLGDLISIQLASRRIDNLIARQLAKVGSRA